MRHKIRISRSAGVYAREGQFLVHPCRRTTAGVTMTGVPVIILPDVADDEELGIAVSEALRRHEVNIPHPNPYEVERKPDPILEVLGIKKPAVFHKNAVYCFIVEESSRLSLTPSRKTSTRGGYLFNPDREITLDLPADPSQIGSAVREALSRCE